MTNFSEISESGTVLDSTVPCHNAHISQSVVSVGRCATPHSSAQCERIGVKNVA